MVEKLELEPMEKTAGTEDLLEGKFDIILADPPWDTMAVEDIKEFGEKIPVAKDAALFLCVPNALSARCLDQDVARAWGFDPEAYIACVDHENDLIADLGQDGELWYPKEYLLIAIKGHVENPPPEDRPLSTMFTRREKNGKMPKETYEIIERMFPNRRYLQVFAGRKREGWASLGLESETS